MVYTDWDIPLRNRNRKYRPAKDIWLSTMTQSEAKVETQQVNLIVHESIQYSNLMKVCYEYTKYQGPNLYLKAMFYKTLVSYCGDEDDFN